jgi:hypothetical protein
MIVRYLAAVDRRNGHDQTHHCPQADFRYGSEAESELTCSATALPLEADIVVAASHVS